MADYVELSAGLLLSFQSLGGGDRRIYLCSEFETSLSCMKSCPRQPSQTILISVAYGQKYFYNVSMGKRKTSELCIPK